LALKPKKGSYDPLARKLNDLISDNGGMSVQRLKKSLEGRGQIVSLQAIYYWLAGTKRPSTANLNALCEVFDLNIEDSLELYKLHSIRV
jgi:hypothetical protein